MTVYRKRKTGSLKWLLAIIVFVLGLTVTFSDVEGSSITDNTCECCDQHEYGTSSSNNTTPTTLAAQTETPALILLAGALGAMYSIRQKRA